MHSRFKFNHELCYLLNINKNDLYSLDHVLNILILHGTIQNNKYIYKNTLIGNYLNNIFLEPFNGYAKNQLKFIINNLKIESFDVLNKNYTLVTNNDNDIIIHELDVYL